MVDDLNRIYRLDRVSHIVGSINEEHGRRFLSPKLFLGEPRVVAISAEATQRDPGQAPPMEQVPDVPNMCRVERKYRVEIRVSDHKRGRGQGQHRGRGGGKGRGCRGGQGGGRDGGSGDDGGGRDNSGGRDGGSGANGGSRVDSGRGYDFGGADYGRGDGFGGADGGGGGDYFVGGSSSYIDGKGRQTYTSSSQLFPDLVSAAAIELHFVRS
ncbi:probable H/ACA ribonucleoprotein complex subunit 1 [Arachis ipaensis]|uniref:probable H/ACA ribonucleoprotein complex subunit 1 n=1 Tax=Arachis ipaensis TaxID=130454 RepID=UPI0007AF56CD|nr:probable H/ACA ribonucleoprotein complex subunit 1 [Arachis ipaensis]XP_025652819.1 probable H/ACA ribonucleoprotein complex subunit 1 [Arachis hypogaea]